MNNLEQLELFSKNIKSLIIDLETEAQNLYLGYKFENRNGKMCEIIAIYYDPEYNDLRAKIQSYSFTFNKRLCTIPGLK